jgi:hypothetical protein
MAVGLRSFELVETREADFGNAAVSRPFFDVCFVLYISARQEQVRLWRPLGGRCVDSSSNDDLCARVTYVSFRSLNEY